MPTSINIKNTNQRNQIKVSIENYNKDEKTKKFEWTPGTVAYLKPGEQTDVWAAENRKVIIQELPT